MKIKSIQTTIDSEFISVKFPNKQSIILRGRECKLEQILYLLECSFMNDFTDYYGEIDRKKGYNYYPLDGQTLVTFTDGAIRGKDKRVEKSGIIPQFHVIRYVSGSEIRSFYISKSMSNFVDSFSKQLTSDDLIRLVANVNKVCGCEFCKVEDSKITFNDAYTSDENCKLIYLLIAECFQTPEGYMRVILLPNIKTMSGKQQARLIETLDNFNGHELLLSSGNIDESDLSPNSCVVFLTI